MDDLGLLLPNLPLQLALKACAQRGLVLATCSKNIAADVEAALDMFNPCPSLNPNPSPDMKPSLGPNPTLALNTTPTLALTPTGGLQRSP